MKDLDPAPRELPEASPDLVAGPRQELPEAARDLPTWETRRLAGVETLVAALVVTALVTACSTTLPDKYVATAVGFVFLGATWALVWRRDDRRVESAGLSLGGVVLPGPIDPVRLARSAARAIGWATALALVTFVPFYFGWRFFWHPRAAFALRIDPVVELNEIFGQIVIIALPEEAFYRGYLQSRLDEVLPGFGVRKTAFGSEPRRFRLFGASVGPALFLTSVVFALGHFATIREPTRFAVFFPSLAFGWLRHRTRGVGAGIAFHAMCNLFSELLGRGYHLY